MAKDTKDGYTKSFGLDRLTDLEITKAKFQMPKDHNIEESYRYCFGIINPDEEPEEITLRFNAFQGKYIKSLPLHDTQQILLDNEEELRVKLKLCITHDLLMELLSFGDNMKVIAPRSLAKQIKTIYQKAFQQY